MGYFKELIMRGYEFTPRIRQIRESFSLDQAEFAKKLGIPCKTLIDYEKGSSIPSSFVDKLNEVFSVNYEWFDHGSGEPFSNPEIKLSYITQSGYSQRIKEIRESLGFRIADFARQLNIPRSTLVGWEEGKTVSIEILKKLEVLLNVNLNWFLTGEGEMFLKSPESVINNESFTDNNDMNNPYIESSVLSYPKPHAKSLKVYSSSDILDENSFIIPLLTQKLSAGRGSELNDSDENQGYIKAPSYLSIYGKNIAALPVDGDSMYPTLSRGDMVVCDSYGWSGEGIYAVKMEGESFIKRITMEPGKILLISDNPKYPPREISSDNENLELIGRVHCALKKLD